MLLRLYVNLGISNPLVFREKCGSANRPTQAAHGDILEGVLTTIKQIDEFPNQPVGYSTFFKLVASTNPNVAKGSIHTAREIQAGGISLDEVVAFERRVNVTDLPPTPTGRIQQRQPDVELTNNRLVELKDAQKILSSSEDRLEFIKDFLLHNEG